MSKYKFIVEKFNDEKMKWVYDCMFPDVYFAHCYILNKREKSDNKYRILEVIDLYV